MRREEIVRRLTPIVAEALDRPVAEVTPHASLLADLGAESIDFLDIVFRLEKSFDIKISRGELFPEDVLTNPEYVSGGKVGAAGIAELRKRMPFLTLDKFAANPNVKDFGMLLTVQDMVKFVETKMPK